MEEATQVVAIVAATEHAEALGDLLRHGETPRDLAFVLVEADATGNRLVEAVTVHAGRPVVLARTARDLSRKHLAVVTADRRPADLRGLLGLPPDDAASGAADAFLAGLAEAAGTEALAIVFGADPPAAGHGLAAIRAGAGRVLRVDGNAAEGLAPAEAASLLLQLRRHDRTGRRWPVGILRGRLRQQAAIAEFGAEALRSGDLDALLHQACGLVARGLGVRRAKILELLPDGSGLLVRAGVGWEPGVVGQAVIGTERTSSPGYALLTGEAVVADDLERETRFAIPELLRRHGIVSSVNVLIHSERSRFGVLEVDSTRRRSFGRDDVNFLSSCANLVAAAIDRLQASRELERALEERQVLLYELQHRVKNSLQEVAGLVGLERRKIADPAQRQPFDVLQSRLEALGIVYRRLYLDDGHAEVELDGYLAELTGELVAFHGSEVGAIGLDLRLQPLRVSLDVALPLALVACEFVVNSFRHAFPEGSGRIALTLEAAGESQGRLILEDDGVGLPAKPAARAGWGLRLIRRLVEQVGGELQMEGDRGVRMVVSFPRLKGADVLPRDRSGP